MKRPLLRGIGTCIVFGLVLRLAAAAQGYLFNQQIYSHGTGYNQPGAYYQTEAIAQADVNGDGRLDFVTIERYSPDCGLGINNGCTFAQIYLAQPNGTYKLSHSYLFANDGMRNGTGDSVALADVNRDGKPDLIYISEFAPNLHEPDWVVVQLGYGDGTFGEPITITTPAHAPVAIFVGDFNNDGKLDVGYVDGQSSNAYLHLGNGDGSMQTAVALPVDSTPKYAVAADFNKDGKLDIAVATNSLNMLLGNGDGTFRTSNFQPGLTVGGLLAADMNKDGKVDLVLEGSTGNSPALAVLPSNGDGTFASAVVTMLPGENIGGLPAPGDLNDDGIPDIAMTGGWTGVMVLLGNGDGTFTSPHSYGNQQDIYAPNLLVGDYNLDGKLDIMSVSYSNTGAPFSILSNNGDGTFVNGKEFVAGWTVQSVVTGDFDRDGRPDVAVATHVNSKSMVSIYLNSGGGNLQTPVSYQVGNQPYAMVAGDFNHDGLLDLAIADYGDATVSVLLGKGDGTFWPAVSYPVGPFPQSMAMADFNNDGSPDLVVSNYTASTVSILLGNADGTFQTAKSANASIWNQTVATADFNRDGKPDIVVSGPQQLPWILLGNGDGTFQAPYRVGTSGTAGIATADTRGNGMSDLVVSLGGTFQVYLSNGDGTFKSPISNYGGNGTAMTFGDMNGDGKLDAILAGPQGDVSVALGNGDGTFQPAYMLGVPIASDNRTVSGVAVADFNGDGSPDLAVSNYYSLKDGSGLVTLLMSNPVKVFSAASLDFGQVHTGTLAAKRLTLTNQSPTVLSIKGISLVSATLDFTQSDDCGASVQPFGSCTVSVYFHPTSKGLRTGWVLFNDSAVGKPRRIPFSGTGY